MSDHDSARFNFSDDPQVAGTPTMGAGAVLGVILLSLGSAFFLADTMIPHRDEPATGVKADQKAQATAPSSAASAPKALKAQP